MRRRGVRILLWVSGLAAAIVLVIVGVAVAAVISFFSGAERSNVGKLAFRNELRVPPLLEPRIDAGGRKVFDLRVRKGTSRFLNGRRTETLGINGPYLGPTLRASRGDRVLMKVDNRLPKETTLHWHGMHLPAAADGGPHQMIAPGTTWTPSWRIEQPAATLWYHAHLMGKTADHVYRGLAGMFIIDDEREARLALPRRYGVDDIPLILQDKRFSRDGSLDTSESSPVGQLGADIVVNGTHDPYVEVRHRRVRFRLLNASNGRVYNVGLSDQRAFDQVAADAGLLDRSARTTRVQLSPGERAEIVAEFEPGERVRLRSFEPELGTDFLQGRQSGADDTFDLVEVRTARRLASASKPPRGLGSGGAAKTARPTDTRRFELTGSRSINGERMDMGRIDFRAEPGTTEVWEVKNDSGTPHNFHPHGTSFRIVSYRGAPPPPNLRGPKDTVYVPPGESVRLLVPLPRYADASRPFMFHCHVLAHEDRGMMGQFVVSNGPEVGTSTEPGHVH